MHFINKAACSVASINDVMKYTLVAEMKWSGYDCLINEVMEYILTIDNSRSL